MQARRNRPQAHERRGAVVPALQSAVARQQAQAECPAATRARWACSCGNVGGWLYLDASCGCSSCSRPRLQVHTASWPPRRLGTAPARMCGRCTRWRARCVRARPLGCCAAPGLLSPWALDQFNGCADTRTGMAQQHWQRSWTRTRCRRAAAGAAGVREPAAGASAPGSVTAQCAGPGRKCSVGPAPVCALRPAAWQPELALGPASRGAGVQLRLGSHLAGWL